MGKVEIKRYLAIKGYNYDWNEFVGQFKRETKRFKVERIDSGETICGRYKIGIHLGDGGFGVVFCVNDLINSNSVQKAMKVVKKDQASEKELKLILALDHENIVKYYDNFELEIREYGKVNIKLCIVTEFCQRGNLAALIKASKELNRRLEEIEIFIWVFQATTALKYLHSKGIVHRDIKPENILLTASGVVKICDFGFSKVMEDSSLTLQVIGTIPYLSPELWRRGMNGSNDYSFTTDIWSLGCVLYEMITLEKAYPQGPIRSILNLNRKIHLVYGPILIKMLNMDYTKRISSEELYNELLALNEIITRLNATE